MKRDLGLLAVGAIVAILLLGGTNALNLRTEGIQFPDGTVQTSAAVDTTCDGQPCDGTFFTNVTAVAGPGVRVVDSLGQTMGEVVDEGQRRSAAYIKLGTPPEPVLFHMTRQTYMLPYTNRLAFTGPGCTGDVYLEVVGHEQPWWTSARYAFGNEGVIYRAIETGSPAEFEPASKISGAGDWPVGDTTDYCVTSEFPSVSGYPAAPFADLSTLPYVPDFRLE